MSETNKIDRTIQFNGRNTKDYTENWSNCNTITTQIGKRNKALLGFQIFPAKLRKRSIKIDGRIAKTRSKKHGVHSERQPAKLTETFWKNLLNRACICKYYIMWEKTFTTFACSTGLRAIIWKKRNDSQLNAIAFASRYLNGTRKWWAVGDWNLWRVVWALKNPNSRSVEKRSIFYTEPQWS